MVRPVISIRPHFFLKKLKVLTSLFWLQFFSEKNMEMPLFWDDHDLAFEA